MRVRAVILPLAAASMVIGCGQENPAAVGGGLARGGVSTFEAIIEPDRYLLEEMLFTGYTRPQDASYLVAASGFGGAFSANVLANITMPLSIIVVDPAGVPMVDTNPQFVEGTLTLRIDTLRSTSAEAVRLELYRLGETFDDASVTWTNRVDTTGVTIPWTEPGGTLGDFVSDVTWMTGQDSIVFEVDGQTLQMWWDTTEAVRGAVIVATTPGSRLRITDFFIESDARSLIQPDTVVHGLTRPLSTGFVFDPPVSPPAQGILVGGNPAWRTILRFRPGLDTLTVPCPADVGPPGCRLRLSDTNVTRAGLLFEVAASPAGFLPEDSLALGAREALVTSALPVERAPLGTLAGTLSARLAPDRFLGDPGPPVEVPITQYLALLAADSVERRPEPYVGVVVSNEGGTVGLGAFAGLPRLRLVLTVTRGF